jgi:hypothetical protein
MVRVAVEASTYNAVTSSLAHAPGAALEHELQRVELAGVERGVAGAAAQLAPRVEDPSTGLGGVRPGHLQRPAGAVRLVRHLASLSCLVGAQAAVWGLARLPSYPLDGSVPAPLRRTTVPHRRPQETR